MATHLNLDLVDGSVTRDEIDHALDTSVSFAPFPVVDDDQDDAGGAVALVAQTLATRHQAILNSRHLRDDHVFVGVGQCWAVNRGRVWQLAALWPTANIGAQHGAPIHRVDDFADIPRSVPIGFINDHLGHVTHGVGGGLNSTTDQHENGFVSIATIESTAEWCGATDVFWFETVNAVDVIPDPAKPKPEPDLPLHWTLEQKAAFLKAEIADAQERGHEKRVERLRSWRRQILARIEARQ